MNPTLLIAIIAVALTVLSGLAGLGTLLFKMGRWQSKAEGRALVLTTRIDGMKEGVDLAMGSMKEGMDIQFKGTHDRLDSMNGSIGEAHSRIDAHLGGHP